MKKTKKGFTLIELIVVLAILAVIMAIAVPTAFGSIDSARKSADRGSIDGFNSTIRMRSVFIASDDSLTKDLYSAINTSGISKTTTAQSDLLVKWHAPVAGSATTAAACGYFEVDPAADGVKLTKGTSLYVQLVNMASGKTTTTPEAADTEAKNVVIMK